jgi:hypothetical protein
MVVKCENKMDKESVEKPSLHKIDDGKTRRKRNGEN